ncbi:hypothetical protein GCM10010169_48490 [Micromonospora fulviviridis]|nr:hypothetical protein GCM10010169_48490 [Micromonospora fulviviridis]
MPVGTVAADFDRRCNGSVGGQCDKQQEWKINLSTAPTSFLLGDLFGGPEVFALLRSMLLKLSLAPGHP